MLRWVPGDWLVCIICLIQMINSEATLGCFCCCCSLLEPFEWKLVWILCFLFAVVVCGMLNSSWHNVISWFWYCSSVRPKLWNSHLNFFLQFCKICFFLICPYFTLVSKMFGYLNFFISNELIINAWGFWTGFKLEFYVVSVKALHSVKKTSGIFERDSIYFAQHSSH